MKARVALLLLAIVPTLVLGSAWAQTGGIQVAPVRVSITDQNPISSVRVRNGRDRAVAFEIDVYEWRQDNGADVLVPTDDVLIAPGVFEIDAGSQQVVRVGVRGVQPGPERAYRMIMRELPRVSGEGSRLGFALEMSLPIFLTAGEGEPLLDTRLDARADGPVLVLSNFGSRHVQLASVEDVARGAVRAPRYLLAGSRAEIPLDPAAIELRITLSDGAGGLTQRLVNVSSADQLRAAR